MWLRRFKIWFRVLQALIRTFPGVSSEILTAEQTVHELQKGKTLIRFGDGEFGIFWEKSIHYQPYTDALGKEFNSIKETYEDMGSKAPFLLAVPKQYMQCSGFALCKRRVLVSSWSESRLYFLKHFDRTKTYGDAFLFQKDNACIYDRLWDNAEDKRLIIFIHNSEVYARQFEQRYNRTVRFIPCKAKNACSEIEVLQQKIMGEIGELEPKDIQVVVSAGPAGKILAYRLSMRGYQCIDAGHCWDEPLEE